MYKLICGVLLSVGLVGCGGDPVHDDCIRWAQALASAGARCGDDYQTDYILLSGKCDKATTVRNENDLLMDCIPFLNRASCTDLQDPAIIPASCKAQFNF